MLSLVTLEFYVNAGLLKHGLSTGKNLLTDITPQKELSKVLGYYQACSSAGFITGPIISGYLINWDPTYVLVAYACSSVFVCNSVLCFLLLPSEKLTNLQVPKKLKKRILSLFYLVSSIFLLMVILLFLDFY